MSEKERSLATAEEVENEDAENFLKVLGVEPTPDRVKAVVTFVQNNTTIHARESDAYLPDAENAAQWDKLVPGSANAVLSLITSIVQGNRDDNKDLNKVRRENEASGFKIASVIALSCVPVALTASFFGVPIGLCIAIVVMGIGGPTAASFFGNWGGKSQD